MRPSPANLLVRANYLATVVFGTFLALVLLVFAVKESVSSTSRDWMPMAVTLLIVALYLVPGVRSIRRVFSQGTSIPPELVHERPVVASVVTLFGAAGHFFFVIVMWAFIDIAARPEWPDDVGGPMAFFFGLTMLSYLVALLCAELALVGNGISDATKMGSDPVS